MIVVRWADACRLLALAALLGIPQIAAAQQPEAAAETTVVDIDANGLDPLARRLTPKERSQRINLKTYSDEEWGRLEREVRADLAACDKGDAGACLRAGDAFLTGDGVWPVARIAETLYKEACDADNGEGCAALAALVETVPVGIQYEPSPGFDDMNAYLEKACRLGDQVSCDEFAWRLRGEANRNDQFRRMVGLALPVDLARSDALLESTCKAGGTTACLSIAELLQESGTPAEIERAASMLDDLCGDQVIGACQMMVTLAAGDEPRINRYLHAACHLKDAAACIDMAERAFRGIGTPPSRDLALAYYDEACRREAGYCEIARALRTTGRMRGTCPPDDARACTELGRALAVILSPEHDRQRASALLEAGCRAGVAGACVDAVEAVPTSRPDQHAHQTFLLETGCTAGDSDACSKLAQGLETGTYGIVDPDRAVALYAPLCDKGFPGACDAEERFAGFVPGARIRPANADYLAPLDSTQPRDLFAYTVISDCFTASARFRGELFIQENCSQREKGIGSERARPGQAPWQALLWRPERLNGSDLSEAERVLCGGSVIAQGWILTAAHCLTDNGVDISRGGHRIRLGVFNPQDDQGVSYRIIRALPHPEFDMANKYLFDIALIQYDHRAPSVGTSGQFRLPIAAIMLDPLPVGKRRIANGMPVYSFGWGWTATEKSASTDYLQVIAMELASEPVCTALTGFRKALDQAALCAGGKQRQQTCFGDSGGPLVSYGDAGGRPVLLGVVSAGKKCGTTGRLSQYTRIAKVRDWIERTMRLAR